MSETMVELENPEVSLMLRYTGPAVDAGAMDVYDTAMNMTAFSDYVVVAAHLAFGAETHVKADVTAFRAGSFTTDLMFQFAGLGTAIFASSTDLSGLLLMVKESLNLYRFLQGKKPSKTTQIDDHSVNVTNHNGVTTTINIKSLHLTMDPVAGKAAGKFVGEALIKPGIDSVSVSIGAQQLATATPADAIYFRPIDADEQCMENVVHMTLTIETPSFKDGRKWQFWDGETTIQASMEDDIFLGAVEKGEAFRKGDILKCDVRIRQIRTPKALRLERAVIHVLKHEPRSGDQTDLFDATQ